MLKINCIYNLHNKCTHPEVGKSLLGFKYCKDFLIEQNICTVRVPHNQPPPPKGQK